jgi:hypothetical protein
VQNVAEAMPEVVKWLTRLMDEHVMRRVKETGLPDPLETT